MLKLLVFRPLQWTDYFLDSSEFPLVAAARNAWHCLKKEKNGSFPGMESNSQELFS